MRPVVLASLLAAALPLALPAQAGATVDLTAHAIRVADHPAFIRVVVDFTDGTLGLNDSEATDANPFPDGVVRVDVRHVRVQAQAPEVTRAGVRVRILQGRNRIRIRLDSDAGRFKYARRQQLGSPERVVLDLYKSRPAPGGSIRSAADGCLTIGDVTSAPGGFRVSGRARQLFEASFQLIVRDARGRVRGSRVVTANGTWTRRVRYDVGRRQRGTIEAVALSARDGALDCLAQLGVTLRP
jgi:hypothetical protein